MTILDIDKKKLLKRKAELPDERVLDRDGKPYGMMRNETKEQTRERIKDLHERFEFLGDIKIEDKMGARNLSTPKEMRAFVLTYSNMSLYLTCPRKYKYRQIDKLIPIGWDPEPLRFGARFHDILEFHYQGKNRDAILEYLNGRYPDRNLDRNQAKEHAKLLGMYDAYLIRYPKEKIKILETEKKFEMFIVNPQAKRKSSGKSRNFKFSGKVDAIGADIDGLFLMEHKTTSRLDPAYMDKVISFDLQIKMYTHYISELIGEKIRRVLYNVVQKPSIRLKEKESAKDYLNRVNEWYATRPDSMWRQEIIITDSDIEYALKNMWYVLHHIKMDLNQKLNGQFWPQNHTSCEKWGRFCEYFPICASNCNPNVIRNEYMEREPNSELRDESEPVKDIF